MNKLEVYVDRIKLELFDDEVITLTQTLKNIKKIDSIFSDYSQDFSIPANSKQNQKAFKRYEDVNRANGYDNRIKHEAVITLGGSVFKTGYVQVNDVKIKNGVAESYSIKFTGGLSNLKSTLKSNKLSSLTTLDSPSNYLSISANSIKSLLQRDASLTSVNLPNGFDLIASLITTEGGVFFNSGSYLNDTPNASYNVATDNGLYYKNIKPSIRLNAIIRSIEEVYNITFTNDFFKNDNVPEMNKLFMYLNKEKGEIKTSDEDDSYLQTNYSVTDWSLTASGGGTSSDWYDITPNSAGRITINEPETFITRYVRTVLSITPENPNLEYQLRVYRLTNGDLLVDEWRKGDYQLEFEGNTLTGDIIIRAGIEGDNNIAVDLEYILTGSGNNFTLSGSAQSTENIPYSITNNLPDITIETFLKGLIGMFNLVAIEQSSGDIMFKPFVDYIASGKDTDITKYVDDSSASIDGSYQYSGVRLNYEESKDKNSLAINNFQGKEYGEYSYKAVDINVGGSEYSIRVPFQLLRYRKLTDDVDGSGTDIQIGEVVDENNNSIITKPIIYYPQKVDIAISYRESVSSSIELRGVNIPSNNLELYSNDSNKTITFGVETDSYTFSRGFNGTLWSRYYNRVISPLFNIRGRILKVTAYLPLSILTDFSLADRFIYKNMPYRINSIKTNLQDGKSDIELLTDSVFENTEFGVLTVGDAPIITILGSNPHTVSVSSFGYTDSGATANDTEDGALTVETIQPLSDISSAGTYHIRYKAVDSDNNVTIATRTVIVEDTSNPTAITWSFNSKTSTTCTVNYDFQDLGSGLGNIEYQYKLSSSSDWIVKKTENLGGITTSYSGTFIYKGLVSGSTYNFRAVIKDMVNNQTITSTVTQTLP
jgi:hypothetical protein